jgi:hypothetical protein
MPRQTLLAAGPNLDLLSLCKSIKRGTLIYRKQVSKVKGSGWQWSPT